MMRTKLVLLCALIAALSVPAAAGAQEEPPQINWEAALAYDNVPSGPCLRDFAVLDVLDFIDPARPDMLFGNIARADVCTGVTLVSLGFLETQLLAEDEFVVSHGGERGDLDAEIQFWDDVSQRFIETSISLRWDVKHAPGPGEAQVTGKIRNSELMIHLKPSFQWNRWGSEAFPWAGFWFCDFSPEGPGCIGQ